MCPISSLALRCATCVSIARCAVASSLASAALRALLVERLPMLHGVRGQLYPRGRGLLREGGRSLPLLSEQLSPFAASACLSCAVSSPTLRNCPACISISPAPSLARLPVQRCVRVPRRAPDEVAPYSRSALAAWRCHSDAPCPSKCAEFATSDCNCRSSPSVARRSSASLFAKTSERCPVVKDCRAS